jgi:CRP-like cAMP-binding protein
MEAWREKIAQIFTSQAKVESAGLDLLLSRWNKKIQLRRNDFLIQKGQVETKLYFALSGTMRIYFPNKDEEICVGFAYANNVICSYPSFIKDVPSDYYIQALTKSELFAITKEDFYSLFDEFPMIERTWRRMEEDALVGKIEREVELLTFTPEERYHRLIKRSPHIFQLIPKKYIASYLRMTPETLSRIRPS